MSAYDALIDECAKAARKAAYDDGKYWDLIGTANQEFWRGIGRAVLAEIRRTLETMTPDVIEEFDRSARRGCVWTAESLIKEFLRVCPLVPPKAKP